jgi:hypothetical protein
MKKFLLSSIVSGISLMALNPTASAHGLSDVGPLTITWKVAQQVVGFDSPPVLSTNHTSKATNYVSTSKYTSSTTAFNDASLIDLLTNSFKTNFAKGSVQLVTDGDNVYLVDKTGTNVVLDVSSVLTVTIEYSVYSGGEVQTKSVPKATNSPTTTTAVGTASIISYLLISYNDSSQVTSNVTQFQFYGVSTGADDFSSDNDFETETIKENFSLQGVGQGTILGTPSIIWGTVTGSSKGTED